MFHQTVLFVSLHLFVQFHLNLTLVVDLSDDSVLLVLPNLARSS